MNDSKSYWFPAKKFGWGWGPPRTWQGWAVLAVYFALVLAGIPLFDAEQHPWPFIAYGAALSLALVGVCWLKGEPPRWRSGE